MPARHNPLRRSELLSVLIAAVATVLSGIFQHAGVSSVLTFCTTAVALAFLATLVGDGTEQIGARLGPGATGVLQSGLGNLPELFIGIFLIKKGADQIPTLQAALIGSILGNSLLVLGLAFLIGGLRHGAQRFTAGPVRSIATLSMLAAAALAVPTLAWLLNTSAARHEESLSVACAIVLLVVFVANIPSSLSGGPARVPPDEATALEEEEERAWPMWLALVILLAASVAAAFVSDWFVNTLQPATKALHISERFTGLVIVAIAGNAVENVVGIQLMARNKPDYAISVILNSSLQIALGLIPALVLLSFALGGAHLTLVLTPPLLLGALLLATILIGAVVYDGESTWLEGVALIGLYIIIAAGFWWG